MLQEFESLKVELSELRVWTNWALLGGEECRILEARGSQKLCLVEALQYNLVPSTKKDLLLSRVEFFFVTLASFV